MISSLDGVPAATRIYEGPRPRFELMETFLVESRYTVTLINVGSVCKSMGLDIGPIKYEGALIQR